MKIEVDLNDIFSEETADCTLEEAIRVAVLESLSKQAERKVREKLEEEIKRVLPAKVQEVIESVVPGILDYEFTETSNYGAKSETTTVRNRICKDMAAAMKWKDGHYDSDKSPYTKLVQGVVKEQLAGFAKEFHKEIDGHFLSACIGYAQAELKKKLGIA